MTEQTEEHLRHWFDYEETVSQRLYRLFQLSMDKNYPRLIPIKADGYTKPMGLASIELSLISDLLNEYDKLRRGI